MAERRNVGINVPRIGVTQSLDAPGITPQGPAPVADMVGLLNQFVGGIAGATAQVARLKQQKENRLFKEQAIGAWGAGAKGEIRTDYPTKAIQREHDKGRAFRYVEAFDFDKMQFNPGDDPAEVFGRTWEAIAAETGSSPTFRKEVMRLLQPRVRQWLKQERAVWEQTTLENTLDSTARRLSTAKDAKTVNDILSSWVTVAVGLGMSEAAARTQATNRAIRQAANEGNVDLVKLLAPLADVAGKPIEIAQENYRQYLAESAIVQLNADIARAPQELAVLELHRKRGTITAIGAEKNKRFIQALVHDWHLEQMTANSPTIEDADSYRKQWDAAIEQETLSHTAYSNLNTALQKHIASIATGTVYAMADSPDSTLDAVEAKIDGYRADGTFAPERAVDVKRDVARYMKGREHERAVGEVIEEKTDAVLDNRDSSALIGELIRRGIAKGEPASSSGTPPRYRGVKGNQHLLWASALNKAPEFLPDDIMLDMAAKTNSPDSATTIEGVMQAIYLKAVDHPHFSDAFDAMSEVGQGRVTFALDQFEDSGGSIRNLNDPEAVREWVSQFSEQLADIKPSGLTDDNVLNLIAGNKFDEKKAPTINSLIAPVQKSLQKSVPDALIAKRFWRGRLKEIEPPPVNVAEEWIDLVKPRIRTYVSLGMSHESAVIRANQDADDIIIRRYPPIVWNGLTRWRQGGGPQTVGGERMAIIKDLRTQAPELDIEDVERNYRPRWSEQDGGTILKRDDVPFDTLLVMKDGQPVRFVSKSESSTPLGTIKKTTEWMGAPGVLEHATFSDMTAAVNAVGANRKDIETYLNTQGKTGMYEVAE